MNDDNALGMDETMRLLRKAVANKGEDFVYERPKVGGRRACFYIVNGQPSCLIGHVLLDAGFTPREIQQLGMKGAHAFPARMADLNAALILAKAQGKQDAGYTWGRALGSAEKMYRKLGGSE